MTTTKRILVGYRKMKKYLIHAVLQVLFTVPVYLIPALIGSIAGTLVDSVLFKNQALRLNAQFLLIGATVVSVCVSALRSLYTNWSGQYIQRDLRTAMFVRLLDAPLNRLTAIPNGDFQSRMFKDVAMMYTAFFRSVPALVSEFVAGLIAILYCVSIDFKLALVYIVSFPVCVYFGSKVAVALGNRRKQSLSAAGDSMAAAMHILNNRKSYVADGLHDGACEWFDKTARESYEAEKKEIAARRNMQLARLLSVIPPVGVFAIGALLIFKNEMTIGQLLAFIAAVTRFDMLLYLLPAHIGDTLGGLAAHDRVSEILNVERESEGGAVDAPAADAPAIELSDLSFGYSDAPGSPVIKGLNLTIRPGERILITGASGCGKSTLLKLIVGYLQAGAGKIRILGSEIAAWNRKALWRNAIYISPDVRLLNGTIRDNLTLGQDFTDEQIRKAAGICLFDSVLEGVDGGLDAGMSGNTALSEGQAARLALTRAVLRQPRVLLLDEITRGLDAATEALLIRNLFSALPGVTLVMISHRLEHAPEFDRVLVFENGGCQCASHEALLTRSDAYRQLFTAGKDETLNERG